jgi:hypothetical protein
MVMFDDGNGSTSQKYGGTHWRTNVVITETLLDRRLQDTNNTTHLGGRLAAKDRSVNYQ